MDVGRGSSSLGMDVDFSGPCLPVQIYHYRHDSLSEKVTCNFDEFPIRSPDCCKQRTKSNSPKESQSAPIKLPSASISRALSPARLPSSPSTPIGANVSEGEEQTLHESNVRRKQRKTIRIPTRHSKIADLKIEEETELELNAEIPMAEVTGIFLEETEIPGTNAESSSHKSGKRHSRHRRSASSSVVTDKEVRSQRRTKSQPLKNLRLEKKKGPEAEEAEKDQNPSLELSGKNEVVHEDPRLYYARKRRSTASSSEAPDTTAGNISTLSRINESQNDSVDIMASTSSALYSSMQSSIVTLNSEANLSRTASFTGRENYENIANLNTTVTGEMDAAAEQLSQTLAQAMSDNGFLKAGNQTLFDVTHDKAHRSLILTDLERFKYSTLNDPGIPHDPFTELPIEDPEQISLEKDPHGEIDKISVAIKQSSAPVPSNFRRRGYLFMKIGRFDDALHDLDKAITFGKSNHINSKRLLICLDPFNTDAFWLRHQLHLQAKDVELAVKDLNSITDNVKSHFGAFDAKARIYHALSLARLAIINYSAVIRLKPEFAYGYYRRACLFEEENEPVYANEDFRAVRQLDPTNQHAIFNLALYSFQRQLWDDSIQAFTKLISMNPDNGQGYLFRGRAYASLSRWDEALEDLTTSIKICPDKYQGFFHRGCLLRDRNPGQALIDFSTSILLDDTALNADAFYHRSLIYMKQGEDAAALADLKTVVALDETKSLAYLELGVLNMRLSKDHEQSLSYLNKAIEHGKHQILSRIKIYWTI